MGLFDRNKDKKQRQTLNAYQINDIQEVTWTPFTWCMPGKTTPLGNFFLQSCLNMIWQGVNNVMFRESGRSMVTPSTICTFMEKNAISLVNMYIQYGYMVVFYDRKGNYRVPTYTELKFDTNGRVINKFAVVIYSPQYQTERKSIYNILLPVITWINKTAGTADYTVETLGTLGILTGSDLPTNPTMKKNFLDNFNQTYGLGDGRYPFLMSNREIKYIKIDPNIKDLGFDEKIKRGYQYICNMLGIPLQLIFNDASTFNNMKEAKIYFFDNTIRYFAEQLLKVARELLTASADFIPQNAITYAITNVPELEKTLSGACEERKVYLEYLLQLRDAGVNVDKQISELYEESKNMLKEI